MNGAQDTAKNLKTPTIIFNNTQAFLVVDCTIVSRVDLEECAEIYLGAYYAFHCAYPKALTGLCLFLEKLFSLPTTSKPGLQVARIYNLVIS